MSFQNTLEFEHTGDDFKKQNLGCSEVVFNEDNNAILGFIRDLEGIIVREDFPLEGFIESVPIFVNSASFPSQLPSSFVESVLDAGTNVAIEFRSADREDMADATEWNSISVEGATSNTDDFLEEDYDGPFSSEPNSLIVSSTDNGFNMTGLLSDVSKEFVYFTSEIKTSSVLTKQAKYLSFEVESDRAGTFLELHVAHGLDYPIAEPFGDVPPPFKLVTKICKAGTPQTVYWDITDWPEGERNWDYIRALAFKVVDAREGFGLEVRNIKLFEINDSAVAPPGAGDPPLEISRFVQYRVVFSTIGAGITPEVKKVKFDFTHRPAMLPSDIMRHQKFFGSGGLEYPARNGLDIVYP